MSFGRQFLHQGRHAAGGGTAGICFDVLCQGRLFSASESHPQAVDGRAQSRGVRPVIHFARTGFSDDPGHGAVGLADSENGPAGAQVFEQFPGQGRPVFRLLPERKDQHGGVQLLPDCGQVVFVAQIHQLVRQTGVPDGLQHGRIGLAHQPQPQFRGKGGVFPHLVAQGFPQRKRIAVGGEKAGMGHVEEAVRLDRLRVIVRIIPVGDQFDAASGHGGELVPDQRGDRDDGRGVVQDRPLQFLMPAACPGSQT